MTTNAKRKFKRFEIFYKQGQLQPSFIQNVKATFEDNFHGEIGVVASWFEYCEETHGKIDQPLLGGK